MDTSSPSSDTSSNLKCGFVAVIGAPNAGKSTLINALVGTKVSIVSPKVQTTRSVVRGIALYEDTQIILLDTPGLFAPQKRLERAMVDAAWRTEAEGDYTLILIDASSKKAITRSREILSSPALQDRENLVLVLNKIDQLRREELLALSQALNEDYQFTATFMISALKDDGTKELLQWLAARMPEGPWHYPEDQVSDLPMRLLAAEITREKLFRRLHEELPYGLTVETESWEQFDNGSIKIGQVIHIAKDSHKGIILGKGGRSIKAVGAEARKELSEILETEIHLKLFVKLNEKWAEDSSHYALWELNPDA